MKPTTFNQALRATARIACCAAIVGLTACDTKVYDCDDPDVNCDSSRTDTLTDTGDTDSQSDNEIFVPEEPNFEECMDAIDAGYADPEFDTSVLLDCCLLTTEQVGFDALYNDPEYAELNENCCSEIANQGEFSAACTPWGPPTPPSMCSKGAANA